MRTREREKIDTKVYSILSKIGRCCTHVGKFRTRHFLKKKIRMMVHVVVVSLFWGGPIKETTICTVVPTL
jgi:hypothetical protein